MSASAQINQKNDISCFEGTEVRFSFVIYLIPKKMSFTPLRSELEDFQNYLGKRRFNYDDSTEDQHP